MTEGRHIEVLKASALVIALLLEAAAALLLGRRNRRV